VSLEEAVGTLKPTDHVVLPPGCGEVSALEREIVRQTQRLAGMTIYSGLLLGDYPFLAEGTEFRYGTWHVMRPARKALEQGKIDFYPVRGSQVTELFKRGHLRADVAVVHVSPPDRHGYCSLGVSVSYPMSLSRLAPRVIAQVNPRMPRTLGRSFIHVSQIEMLVEVDEALLEYPPAETDPVSKAIGAQVADLIPDGATLQIGLGSIPEAVLTSLRDIGKRDLQFFGMGIDGMVDLADAGVMRRSLERGPGLIGAELMGTTKLFDFAAENPTVEMHPSEYALNPTEMWRIDNFISINSALEIDLTGQVNAEYVGGNQVGGIGGSFDFVQGASFSVGGKSILAIPAADGRKRFGRIVSRLTDSAPVSMPRHYVDYVVTEHGTARLAGLSLRERANALIAVAEPSFRDELREFAHSSSQDRKSVV
jgi:4-hydroxybutyrate CoA-transferase